MAERTELGQKQVIDESDYTAHVFRSRLHGDLASVTVTDKEYPIRAATCVLAKIIDEFTRTYSPNQYSDAGFRNQWNSTLIERLQQFQSPDAAMDKVAQIQRELDDTKEVMVGTLISVISEESSRMSRFICSLDSI